MQALVLRDDVPNDSLVMRHTEALDNACRGPKVQSFSMPQMGWHPLVFDSGTINLDRS